MSFLARATTGSTGQFTVMETGYLALQFGLYGLMLGLIHRKEAA